MTKTRFSHAACQHPSTKAGRARVSGYVPHQPAA